MLFTIHQPKHKHHQHPPVGAPAEAAQHAKPPSRPVIQSARATMFNGLKKRVHSVLQEGRNLSENLSNTLLIRPHSSGTSPHTTPTSPAAATVACQLPASDAFPYAQLNVHAGVSRLAATELDWQQLHEAGAANAATADRLDADIQQVRTCPTYIETI